MTLLDRPMRTTGGRFATMLLAMIAGAAGAVLELGGDRDLRADGGRFGRGAGWDFVRGPSARRVAGYLPLVALLLPGIVMTGCLNSSSEVPIASYVMVAAAPLALALPLAAGRKRMLVQGGLVLLLLVAAVALAYHAEPVDWQAMRELMSG